MPEDSAFPRAPAAGCEDGGGGGPAPLKRRQWSLPRRRGRSGSLIRTGSRVTASCFSRCCSTLQSGFASSSCASFLGSTSSWSAARYQTASFAGSDPGARGGSGLGLAGGRAVTTACVPRFVVRTMCAVLGLVARQEDSGLRDHRVRVLISNHVTPFDHNIVNLLTSCSTPLLNSPPSFVCWSRGFMEMDGRGELVESLKRFCASTRLPPTPLLLFPEEEATNGREGLLRFSSWPFSIQDVVQPLTLRVQRPLVSVTVSDASWVSELLWSLFVPFTVYQVRWLRPVHRQLGEGSEEFSLRVQQLVAKELGQTGTQLTPADKAEHMKRQRHPRLRPQSAQSSFPPSPGPSPDVQLATLAQRVKEVLPHVPLGVIQRDLARTGCVDLTITNLLEGAVTFMPEDITERTQALPTASTPKFPSSGPATPQPTALTFAKSSWARQESLQERKQALYEYARRRFTERQAQEAD
ncbi:lipid droplet-regulating VLDL assembly factor AUP1 isoform X1 [Balaenoptera acutorostrata]|uniref:Lipid droplet-regulating VLDL assembly factor AUP1 n=1 Tax=Balaenoptera acutorostrata TaxID=9767 RepID=A0A384A9Q2_BALAC|nr:lipid droplet-regulating VLDL assembly factor AUP1 isoform X1 [Balaenoptera acutorostrata]